MSPVSIVTLILIFAGTVVMAANIFKFRRTTRLLNRFYREGHDNLPVLFQFHQLLIIFFLLGYLAVFGAVWFEIPLLSNLFVGVIFFLGAIFVLFSILVQSRMVTSVKSVYEQALGTSDTLRAQRSKLMEINTSLQHEIAERRQAQAKLQQSEQFLQHILDAYPEPLMVINRDYSVALANKAIQDIARITFSSNCNQLTCYHISHHQDTPCKGSEHLCPLTQVFETGEKCIVEHKHFDADGRPMMIEIIAAPIFDESGNIIQVIESCRDITERKKNEERMRQMQKMDAIGALAGGIAHDFNNILSAVMGYVEISLLDSPSDRLKWRLERILQASQRAKDLVNQILTFSRQKEPETMPILIGPIIEETLKLLRASIPATIEFSTHIDSAAGIVMADPTQIHQILMNLCTNAAYAMKGKNGRLSIHLENIEISSTESGGKSNLPPGPYSKLRVEDTGCGMDPITQERIFEPFFTTKGPGEGTGLGLSAVHGIVQQLGGAIEVASEPGGGTIFDLFFPCVTNDLRPQSAAELPAPRGHERILLVDDEPYVLDMTKEMLVYYGYSVDTCTNGPEAMRLFASAPENYKLVITDFTMPKMTGMELIAAIRNIKPDIPVIISTGFGDKIFDHTITMTDLDGFLMKPIVMKDLAHTVRRSLDRKLEQEPAA